MSFSVWPMTLRQNRSTAFALMPVGRLLASGRCVARISDDPGGRATLDQVGADLLELGAVLRVLEPHLALVDPDHDRVQPQRLLVGQFVGDLVLRAHVPRQLPDHLGPAPHLGAQLAHRGDGVLDVLVVVAAPGSGARPAPTGRGRRCP